jgi:hypothetical protein
VAERGDLFSSKIWIGAAFEQKKCGFELILADREVNGVR